MRRLIFICLLSTLVSVSAACHTFCPLEPREPDTINSRLPKYHLVIKQYPAMTSLIRVPLKNIHEFALSFIHSVTMTPVRDNYEITPDGSICQISEVFESHCAGLPYSDEETGATRWEQKEGKFILHMERNIPKLVVRTDKRYRNRLHIQDQVIDLNQWEDQALFIAVER